MGGATRGVTAEPSSRDQNTRRKQDVSGTFGGSTRLWTAGCWLARQLHQLKTSITMNLGIDVWPFEKLIRVDLGCSRYGIRRFDELFHIGRCKCCL